MNIRITQKSIVARLAAHILHEERMAVVIGKTIYLWNTSRQNFLKNKKWLHHELVHVQQFRQYGFIKFLFLYLLESLKNGYYNNKFEVEAREKENDEIPIFKASVK
jgi:hypothetical protein